jgi:hypothetical protein
MARQGKSYIQIADQWHRITDELERRSGGVQYCINGDHNIALYEKATEAAARYTRNIEHTPEGLHSLPNGEGERFLNKVFPRSIYMAPEKKLEVEAQQIKRPHFDDATVFMMKDGSYAIRGTYEGQHLQPKVLSDTDVKMYQSVDGRAAKDAVLQGIMARRYAKEINHQGHDIKNGLSL